MRLLNTHTGALEWHHDPAMVRYAILSHVWAANGEESYKDAMRIHKHLQRSPAPSAPGSTHAFLSRVSAKIRDCCAYARQDGYDLLWIDSCCIDKSSSAELSEAINSMYQWYEQSTVCYAFLFDVDGREDPRAPGSRFRTSGWFARGWTLQELIAPLRVVFLSSDWRPLGTLSSLVGVVEEVTGIDRGVLLHQTPLSQISVARRMSWASKRVTTRVEDEAYSLMGIFGVMMPTIYGEGRAAFRRLQEEILKQAPDQTIFVWGSSLRPSAHPAGIKSGIDYFTLDNVLPRQRNLFASSPRDFADSADVEPVSHLSLSEMLGGLSAPFPEYTVTGYGIRTQLPLLPPRGGVEDSIHIGVLSCTGSDGNLVGLFFHANRTWMSNGYFIGMTLDGSARDTVYRTVPLTEEVLSQWGSPEVAEVYLPTRVMTADPWAQRPSGTSSDPFATYRMILPDWRKRELAEQGYEVSCTVESSPAQPAKPPSHLFILAGKDYTTISILLGGCICSPGPADSQYGRMRAVVVFEQGPTARTTFVASIESESQATRSSDEHLALRREAIGHQRTVVHDVAHPDHVNSRNWLLDDESCGAMSRDFVYYAGGDQNDVPLVVRLTLSPSPEHWSESAPRTWDNVYTLDIEILDRPGREERARSGKETSGMEGKLLVVSDDWDIHSNLWGYDQKKGKFFMARRARLRGVSGCRLPPVDDV
ncbi:HET-domain-containing protein [Trametes cingulata]|nr:HET-domain-containing protein [Trametes cingulata]